MRKYLLKIVMVCCLFVIIGCSKNEEKIDLPDTPSQIYLTKFTKEEHRRYIDLLADKIKDDDLKYTLLRGFFYLSSWESEKALADFQTVLKNDSTTSDAYVGIAICYIMKDSVLFMENINNALRYNPNNAFAYFIKASPQNYEESIEDYNKAIELEQTNANYYFWRGVKYDFVDSIALAKEDFNKAIELDSTLVTAYSFLGIRAEYEKQNEDALRFYSLMIKYAPDKHWGYENRGEMYHRINLFDKAIADYKKAVQYLTPTLIGGKEIFLSKKKYFYYDIAINYCLLHNDSVYNYLELTFEEDSGYVRNATNDAYFKDIRKTERFKNLINKYSNQ